MSREDLDHEAQNLPSDERLELAYSLIRSVGGEDNDLIERLWAEEAERRYQEYLDGKVEAVPGDEAIRRIRAALR